MRPAHAVYDYGSENGVGCCGFFTLGDIACGDVSLLSRTYPPLPHTHIPDTEKGESLSVHFFIFPSGDGAVTFFFFSALRRRLSL